MLLPGWAGYSNPSQWAYRCSIQVGDLVVRNEGVADGQVQRVGCEDSGNGAFLSHFFDGCVSVAFAVCGGQKGRVQIQELPNENYRV